MILLVKQLSEKSVAVRKKWRTGPYKISDKLYLFITNNIKTNYLKMDELFDLTSDHSLKIMILSEHILKNNVTQP